MEALEIKNGIEKRIGAIENEIATESERNLREALITLASTESSSVYLTINCPQYLEGRVRANVLNALGYLGFKIRTFSGMTIVIDFTNQSKTQFDITEKTILDSLKK